MYDRSKRDNGGSAGGTAELGTLENADYEVVGVGYLNVAWKTALVRRNLTITFTHYSIMCSRKHTLLNIYDFQKR